MRAISLTALLFSCACLLGACGETPAPDDAAPPEDDGGAASCDLEPFEAGDPDGHADPLGVGPGEARAGRVEAAQLPPFPSGLQVWEGGDFVLANEHVAMVIEDAGASDLYDPWGGRPVGVARVEEGALVDPADFGEILILLGRMTVLTRRVTVLADGSDGGAAIVRAEGAPRPLPFFESVTGGVLPGDFDRMDAVIDYVLEPGARHVDVFVGLRSRDAGARSTTTMHAFMHTPRMPPFAPGVGFETEGASVPWVGFADPDATSFAYMDPARELGAGLEISGFVSFFTRGVVARVCEDTRLHHARVVIGGPGVSGLLAAVLETRGEAARTVRGVVRDASGAPAAGAWVLAQDGDAFLSRARTGADGSYAITVPADAEASLSAFRRGDAPTTPTPAPGETLDLTFGEAGQVHVVATDPSGARLPVRVQVLPAPGESAREPAGRFGVPAIPRGRVQVAFAMEGEVTLRAPAGPARVVVSRGYEYELASVDVTLAEGATVEVPVTLERVVDTTDVQCADFHIHTHRSNDSGDDAREKVASAVADGLELPVRSDHEYPGDFSAEIEALGVGDWAFAAGSVEMTSFEAWGHMGVFPLERREGELNAGTPRWQTYPTVEDPDAPIVTLGPTEVFDMVRARPEAPVVIINHPRGDPNYFDFVGYDPVTGAVDRPGDWDEAFTLVEVFNDADWRRTLDRTVVDWLSFLRAGRRVFAVGSSDSHALSRSPVGYPRTCLRLGTDDPTALAVDDVRDALAGGRGTISGGVYVDAWVGDAQPGDDATGLGDAVDVRVRVQAASWIDVDAIDVVVDGVVVQTIEIRPEDADPLVPTVRFDADVRVDVAAVNGFVLFAAYGDATLEPVHPGRVPFGVTNPIFLAR